MLQTVQEDAMHVLVIEDDIEMASFIEKVLVEAGHRVDMATDGDSGLSSSKVIGVRCACGRPHAAGEGWPDARQGIP